MSSLPPSHGTATGRSMEPAVAGSGLGARLFGVTMILVWVRRTVPGNSKTLRWRVLAGGCRWPMILPPAKVDGRGHCHSEMAVPKTLAGTKDEQLSRVPSSIIAVMAPAAKATGN